MTESESVALPFGDTPLSVFAAHKTLLYTFQNKNQEVILIFFKNMILTIEEEVRYNGINTA